MNIESIIITINSKFTRADTLNVTSKMNQKDMHFCAVNSLLT